jgi:choline monooxygenase
MRPSPLLRRGNGRESGFEQADMKQRDISEIVDSYEPNAALAEAWTIPAEWYTDPRVFELERRTVFSRSWQMVGRMDQVVEPGQYLTTLVAGEPLLVVRGNDGILRGFFNVCRHHAAAVMTQPEGKAQHLRCPYHGWTYSLNGELKGTPDFAGVCNFDRNRSGLLPVDTAAWENWIFVRLEPDGVALEQFLGTEPVKTLAGLDVRDLHWAERRCYSLDCNWKVFVDNYLDGGYHVPHLHKGLDSVLDYNSYTIETGARSCLQSSPVVTTGADIKTGAVRKGDRALYYWVYPNLMINWYEGVMDTNLVCPRAVDRTDVIFDFYFADTSDQSRERNLASVAVGEQIQIEDVAICESVQRGLGSQAYSAGRLSVRREAGEHLFHKLLYSDLKSGLSDSISGV